MLGAHANLRPLKVLWRDSSLSSSSSCDSLEKLQQLLQQLLDLKSLYQKELTSRPVGQTYHGLDTLNLFKLEIAGTTADKNYIYILLFFSAVTNINS